MGYLLEDMAAFAAIEKSNRASTAIGNCFVSIPLALSPLPKPGSY
jgi:hypothetical protein